MRALILNRYIVNEHCRIGDRLCITLEDKDISTDVTMHVNKPGVIEAIIIYRNISKDFEVISGTKLHVKYETDIHVPADLFNAYHVDDLDSDTILKLQNSKYKYDNKRK
jgi:hypothetical protein